jgi:predicted O-methyltransferase YrrM
LSYLLHAARGRRIVVEIGTASGWTAAALALADRSRVVTTVDPQQAEHRDRYLELIDPSSRSRIRPVIARGEEGPDATKLELTNAVEFLFIDGDHSCEGTIAALQAWRPALATGALIAIHDYGDPTYPGVTEAVHHLGLKGRARGTLLIAPVS